VAKSDRTSGKAQLGTLLKREGIDPRTLKTATGKRVKKTTKLKTLRERSKKK
jgi:hypothetical protein